MRKILTNTKIPYKCEVKMCYHTMQGPNPKGTPNLILHKDGHKYRVRSELLIFKDDKMLISKISDKINQYGCRYKLPGGGVDDPNEFIEEAAAREAEEEVRIRTKNVRYSGQHYEGLYDKIPDWHIHTLHLDGIVYDGYISFICTAEYAGKFNGYIKKMDRDDSINTAKFYSYDEVKGILKPIHREIFEEYLKSRISKESYFGDRINKTLNQEVIVTEGILPNLTFYHGSGTEIKGNYITANSMCLGNRLESASYAVYMWRKKENAYPWALYSLLQIVCEKLNIDFRKIVRLDLFQTPIKINIEESVYDTILNASLGKKCYVYGCSTNITDLGLGHSAYLDEVISKKDVKIVKRETITVTNKFFTDNTSVKSQQWFDSPEEKNKYQNMYAGILTRGVSNLLMYGDDKIFPMRRRIKEKIKEGKFKKGDDLNIIIADIKTEMTHESTEITKKDFKSVQSYEPVMETTSNFKIITIDKSSVNKYKDKYFGIRHLRFPPEFPDYSGKMIIDRSNDEVVGFINIDKSRDLIQALEVNKKYQRRGIATKLLKLAISMGARNLTVRNNNEPAKALYVKNGWKYDKSRNTEKMLWMTHESTEITKKDFKSVHESYMQSILDRVIHRK